MAVEIAIPSTSSLGAAGVYRRQVVYRVRVVAAVAALLAGCGPLPVLWREVPPECYMFHQPGTSVEWSGIGNARELGLWPPDSPDPGEGEIFVGQGRGDPREPLMRMYCFFPDWADTPGEDGPHTGTVPPGWEPP